MSLTADEVRQRTKEFALRNMKVFRALPRYADAQIVGNQLVRAATSVAANYRAACRARSHAEFVAKLCIVVEEADESLFWLEMLRESGLIRAQRLSGLVQEAEELVAMFSASRKTALARGKRSPNHPVTKSPS